MLNFLDLVYLANSREERNKEAPKMPLNREAIYPATAGDSQPFHSRRSVVHSTEGIVACTQPLAARCGLKVLAAGGNAAVRIPLAKYNPVSLISELT